MYKSTGGYSPGDSNPNNLGNLPPECFDDEGLTGHFVARLKRYPNGNLVPILDGFILWPDAKEILRATCSPTEAKDRNACGKSDLGSTAIPLHVNFAAEFIKHCNRVTEPVVTHEYTFGGNSASEIHDAQQLHPTQEHALEIACREISRYLLRSGADLYGEEQTKHPECGDDDSQQS